MSDQVERDIDLVLVTGAGASHSFSKEHLPLMVEWRKRLDEHLRNSVPDFAALVDLNEDITGEEFERRLGEFLQSVRAYRLAKTLVERTTKLVHLRSTQIPRDVAEWYSQIESGLYRLQFAINQSLYEEFGGRYETQLAESLYGEFHPDLGIVAGTSTLVYATTNYDHVGENSLYQLQFHPDLGFDFSPYGGQEFALNPRGLARAAGPNRTPVLHLHGSVGWFVRDDGVPVALTQQNSLNESSSPGVPMAMLPDLNKDYQDFSVIDDVWGEFERVLQRTKAVFVMGHSLNDTKLCETIKRYVPSERVGVGYLPSVQNGQLQIIDRLGISAEQTIPMTFGVALDVVPRQAIQKWRQGLRRP
jgi:hypothetical protein